MTRLRRRLSGSWLLAKGSLYLRQFQGVLFIPSHFDGCLEELNKHCTFGQAWPSAVFCWSNTLTVLCRRCPQWNVMINVALLPTPCIVKCWAVVFFSVLSSVLHQCHRDDNEVRVWQRALREACFQLQVSRMGWVVESVQWT